MGGTVYRFVGGPLDGATAKRATAPEAFSYVQVDDDGHPGRFFRESADGRALYRLDGVKLMFEGLRMARCGGCGCFHERAWTDRCSLCGGTLESA